MKIRDLHSSVEHEVFEDQLVDGYWQDQTGKKHYFSGLAYRARSGLAIGAWVLAWMGYDENADSGYLAEGVVLTNPVGIPLVAAPEHQAQRVVEEASGLEKLMQHARTGGDHLPGGRIHG